MLAVLLAITVVVGAWYFLLRGPSGPGSDFERAEQRYVQAVEDLDAATSAVTFGQGDPVYQVVFQDARVRMQAQLTVFQSLATSEEGQASDVATAAARSAQLGISAAEALDRALFRTNIPDADRAREQLADATHEVQEQGKAWSAL